MFCPNCGTKNEDDAVFCGNCGTPLTVNEQQDVTSATPESFVQASQVEEQAAEIVEPVVEQAADPVSVPQPDFSAQAPQSDSQPDFSAQAPQSDSQPGFNAQAPQFSAQPDFSAQAPQFNAQPNASAAPKKEKKPVNTAGILKIVIPIAVAVVLVIALVATFIGIGKSKTDYKKTAKAFVENYAKADWEAVYDSMDVTPGGFLTKEAFVAAMSDKEATTILSSTYTDTFSQTASMYEGKAILVMYTTPDGSQNLTLNMKPQQKKKMLFFTEYKVDASDFIVKDCRVKVPTDIKTYVNGVELTSNYVDKDNTSESSSMTTYKIPSIFAGSASIKLSAEGMEDIVVDDVVFDENEDSWSSSDHIAMDVSVSVPNGGFKLTIDGEEVGSDMINGSTTGSTIYYNIPFLKIGEHTFKLSGDFIEDYEYKTKVGYSNYSVYIGTSNIKLASTLSSTICKQAEEDFKKITEAAAASKDMDEFKDRIYDMENIYNNYSSVKRYLSDGYSYSNLTSTMTTKNYSYDYSSKLPQVTVKLNYVETTKSGRTYNEYGNIEYVYSDGKWKINEFYLYF